MVGLLLLATFVPHDAAANGRFPASNGVMVDPERPDLVIARVTFGLLVSRDAGHTWAWICESAIGFNGVEDPAYAVTNDGTLLAGTFNGIRYSTDGGCSWSSAAGIGKAVIVDTASRSRNPRAVVALASGFDGQGDAGELRFRNLVFESSDEGRTFTGLGVPLDPLLLAHSIEVAESDPERLYVSASADLGVPSRHTGFVLVSSDRGRTFARTKVALEPLERGPYIAAVDPGNPNRVFARTGGAPDLPSRILLSEDGGKRFRTVYTSKGPLLGFALSPDGTRVFAGGPADGLLVASTKDLVFTKRASVEVQCLRASGAALWVCSNEASGFVLATTGDEGAHFDVKLHLRDIREPLSCAADSPVTGECGKQWFGLQKTLGIGTSTGDGGPPPRPAADAPIAPIAAPVEAPRDARDPWRVVALICFVGLPVVLVVVFAVLRRRRRRPTP
jgi:photosystem II stability/assembly factor-like uncharacterized protein